MHAVHDQYMINEVDANEVDADGARVLELMGELSDPLRGSTDERRGRRTGGAGHPSAREST